MKSLTDELRAEIARRVHPDWRKKKRAYWSARDSLLARYQDQWIGFADGTVVAARVSPVEVLHAARKSAAHPFVICVGREDEPCRIRRTSFAYNVAYAGEPLPVIRAEFRDVLNRLEVLFRGPAKEVVVNP